MQTLGYRHPAWSRQATRLIRRVHLAPEHAAVERALELGIVHDLVRAGKERDVASAVAERARAAAVRSCRELEEDEGMYVEGRGRWTLEALAQTATGRDTLARLADLGVTRVDIVAWYDRSLVERRARIEVHRILLLDAFRCAIARGLPADHAARVARQGHPRYARSVRTIDRRHPDGLLPREVEPRLTRHVCSLMEHDREAALAELRASSSFNAWAWERIQIGQH